MRYDRTVVAYHGCDRQVAEELLLGKSFKQSQNDYDWLGRGIYFWEYGADRALRFAEMQKAWGRVHEPAHIGALIQLGNCFDLLDTRFTKDLAVAFSPWKKALRKSGRSLPANDGRAPDHKLRRLDCAYLNWYPRSNVPVVRDELRHRQVRIQGGQAHLSEVRNIRRNAHSTLRSQPGLHPGGLPPILRG